MSQRHLQLAASMLPSVAPAVSTPAPVSSVANVQRAIAAELNPVSPVETYIVGIILDRVSDLDELRAARDVLRQQGEAALTSVLAAADVTNARTAAELARATVQTSDKHQALLRQSLLASAGLFRSLQEFHDLRERFLAPSQIYAVDPRFGDEPACVAHLVRRYAGGVCGCGRCGSAGDGNYVPARMCWQCRACHAQTGLRVGTCFEASSIQLTKWFAAIRIELLAPSTSAAPLAKFLDIPRVQTVSKMITRIRQATKSINATQQLAGLDQIYLGFS